MTREIIFEAYIYPNWKSRIKSILCWIFPYNAEVWKKICDAPAKMLNTQQEEIGRFKYYIVLCQCTACNRYQLWILKELIKHE